MANASTSWWCSGGEPIYRVCEFSNLYYRDGNWYAGVGRDRAGLIPAVQVTSQHSNPVAPRAVPARRVKAAKAATHHAEDMMRIGFEAKNREVERLFTPSLHTCLRCYSRLLFTPAIHTARSSGWRGPSRCWWAARAML